MKMTTNSICAHITGDQTQDWIGAGLASALE